MNDSRKKYLQISAEKYKVSLYRGSLNKDGNELEEILFPLWEVAVADFLVACDLPATEQLRFKEMPSDEKKSLFRNSQFGFGEFVSNFKKAREMALYDLTTKSVASVPS